MPGDYGHPSTRWVARLMLAVLSVHDGRGSRRALDDDHLSRVGLGRFTDGHPRRATVLAGLRRRIQAGVLGRMVGEAERCRRQSSGSP